MGRFRTWTAACALALVATGATHVVTGNPGCTMQIRAHLRDRSAVLPVLHPVELLLPSGGER